MPLLSVELESNTYSVLDILQLPLYAGVSLYLVECLCFLKRSSSDLSFSCVLILKSSNVQDKTILIIFNWELDSCCGVRGWGGEGGGRQDLLIWSFVRVELEVVKRLDWRCYCCGLVVGCLFYQDVNKSPFNEPFPVPLITCVFQPVFWTIHSCP